jgi:rhodanese-related sulfurtransferase
MLTRSVSCGALALSAAVAIAATSSKPPCNDPASAATLPERSVLTAYAEAQAGRRNDPACAIEAKALVQRKDRPVLIDVRSPSAFGTVWIPGSVNLPVDAVPSNALVRSASEVVLVDDGHSTIDLMQRCGAIRKRGMTQVHVLAGGIVAWRHAGGSLSGNSASLDRPIELDAEALRQTLGDAEVSLVFADVATGDALAKSSRRVLTAKAGSAPEAVLSRVPKRIATQHATVVLVARREVI